MKIKKYNIDSNSDVRFEMGEGIFIPENTGVGLSYNMKSQNSKIFMYLGDHHGFQLGELGFRNYSNQKVNVFGVWEGGIQGGVRDDGDIEVGFVVTDPEGMIIQGKNNEDYFHALQVKDGHENFGDGEQLFSVTNNGNVYVKNKLSVNSSDTSSILVLNGSLSLNVKKLDGDADLDDAVIYIYIYIYI